MGAVAAAGSGQPGSAGGVGAARRVPSSASTGDEGAANGRAVAGTRRGAARGTASGRGGAGGEAGGVRPPDRRGQAAPRTTARVPGPPAACRDGPHRHCGAAGCRGGAVTAGKRSLDALIEEITVDCYGEEELT